MHSLYQVQSPPDTRSGFGKPLFATLVNTLEFSYVAPEITPFYPFYVRAYFNQVGICSELEDVQDQPMCEG